MNRRFRISGNKSLVSEAMNEVMFMTKGDASCFRDIGIVLLPNDSRLYPGGLMEMLSEKFVGIEISPAPIGKRNLGR